MYLNRAIIKEHMFWLRGGGFYMAERVILHSDLNNFYASVECLYRPELRNKPMAVGGDPEQRHGIILAKNYPAKSFGIKTGEAIWQAKQKCPQLIVVTPNFKLYLKFSRLARQIYAEYSDQIEPFGLDESWLDVTGSAGLYGSGETIADEIRHRIKEEMGVTASVGVSFNKIFAKLIPLLKQGVFP
jgi:DNA polymerase-4